MNETDYNLFKERNMFQMADPPPKRSNWQDYFAGGKPYPFEEFLHYYEPKLNAFADWFSIKYGLADQFEDIKMIFVETLLKDLQNYKPADGKEFLANIKLRLNEAVKQHAALNQKGFSESAVTHYFQMRKAAAIYKENQPIYGRDAALQMVSKELNISSDLAVLLVQEMQAQDTFLWYDQYTEDEDGEEQEFPFPASDLEHNPLSAPEQAMIKKYMEAAAVDAYHELTEKEQDIIGMHLGFCWWCFFLLEKKTYDEIADVYQFTSENGVLRAYNRAIDNLRLNMDRKGVLYTVHLERMRSVPGELIYNYRPLGIGEPGTINFDVQKGVVQRDYLITKTAELDFKKSQQIGHAAAKLLYRLAKEGDLPKDRVLPLPDGCVEANWFLKNRQN